MKYLESLTYNGYIEDTPLITVSSIDLIRFLIVYPELMSSKKLSISDIINYLGNDKDDNHLIYDGDYKSLFSAIEAWLEHIIKIQIQSNLITKINILCNITTSSKEPYVISCLNESLIPRYECNSSSLFGFTFTKLISNVENISILYNIEILKEVKLLCK